MSSRSTWDLLQDCLSKQSPVELKSYVKNQAYQWKSPPSETEQVKKLFKKVRLLNRLYTHAFVYNSNVVNNSSENIVRGCKS